MSIIADSVICVLFLERTEKIKFTSINIEVNLLSAFSLATLREELHVLANESNSKSVTKKTEYVYLEERDAL